MQALVKAPQVAVLDLSALLAISDEPERIVTRLRAYCADMTLFLLMGDANLVGDVPLRVVFHGPVGTVEAENAPEAANDAGGVSPRPADVLKMEARP